MDNVENDTASVSVDVAKLVEDTIFWFEQRIEMLNDIIEAEGTVVLASQKGTDTELNDEQSRAFKAGLATAISIIGTFPLSLDQPTYSLDIGELEA